MHKIEFIPSFRTNFWLFSSKGAENSENGYIAFLTIIKESDVFIKNLMLYILEGHIVSYCFLK